MFSRFWTVTGSMFLALLVMGIGFAVMMVPSVAAIAAGSLMGGRGTVVIVLLTLGVTLLMLVGFLWIYLRLALAGPVIGYESLGPMRSLLRSNKLISGRVGPGFMGVTMVRAGIMFTVVFVVLFVVNIISGIPSLILQAVYGGLGKPAIGAPQALLVPAELLQVFVQALFSPIAWVFASVFYVDLRVRKEGLDLELQLEPVTSP
jgi:hypothetical protein